MKNIFIVVFFLCFTVGNAQNWLTNLEEAKTIAKAENKKIVMVFMGSDWCPPCKKMNSKILSSSEFTAHADANYVMVKVDFPKKKENLLSEEQQIYNNGLSVTYNSSRSIPTVLVLNSEGKIIGKSRYKRISPSNYIKLLDSFEG